MSQVNDHPASDRGGSLSSRLSDGKGRLILRHISFFLSVGCIIPAVSYAGQYLVPFQNVSGQIVVAGKISGIESRFIVDTGAGLDMISPSFCKKIGCKQTGSYTGDRYPGEPVTLALTTVKSLTLGDHMRRNVEVGIYPVLDDLPTQFGEIDGILSLRFFTGRAFSLDYRNKKVILEDSNSLTERARSGIQAPISIEEDRYTLTVNIRVVLNDETGATFMIDTGTQRTLVDPELARAVTSVALADAPSIDQINPPIQWKRDNDEGALGSQFLEKYLTTFDISNWRLIFNK